MEIEQRFPTDVRPRCRLHPRAQDPIEHPHRDLSVAPPLVIAYLTPTDAEAPVPLAADDDFLSVQRVPTVVHPTNAGLVITLDGTCTTLIGSTRDSAISALHSTRRGCCETICRHRSEEVQGMATRKEYPCTHCSCSVLRAYHSVFVCQAVWPAAQDEEVPDEL